MKKWTMLSKIFYAISEEIGKKNITTIEKRPLYNYRNGLTMSDAKFRELCEKLGINATVINSKQKIVILRYKNGRKKRYRSKIAK